MKLNVLKRVSFYSIVLLLLLSCSQSCQAPFVPPTSLHDNEYTIYDLDYSQLYYNYTPAFWRAVDHFSYDMDDDSVVISYYNNKAYYNPVNICLKGLNHFDIFMNLHDSLYLDLAYRHRDALLELMDEDYLLEYRMDYHHYDIYLWDPWYSGMAQGLALSLFSRMAVYSNDSLSEALSHHIFETMDPYSELSVEVVDVDSAGYAWIEEYPGNPADRTFNGFMHSIIGIYDYYHLVNSDESVADLLSAYLTTIERYMRDFRNPGDISYYCLRHKHIDRNYHKIHVNQLNLFTMFTGDSTFAHFADTLKADYWDW